MNRWVWSRMLAVGAIAILVVACGDDDPPVSPPDAAVDLALPAMADASPDFADAALIDAAEAAPADAGADTIASLASLVITPNDATLVAGAIRQFTATGTYADATVRDVTALVEWSSWNRAAAAIGYDPRVPSLAMGVTAGATTIAAALDGVMATHPLEVIGPTLVAINVVNPHPTGAPRERVPLRVIGTFLDPSTMAIAERDVSPFVTWHVDLPNVVEVSNAAGFVGRLTFIASGTSALTARLGSLSVETKATTISVSLNHLFIAPASATIAVGGPLRLRATLMWSNGDRAPAPDFTMWTSSNPSVAAFEGVAGVITPKRPGRTTITASVVNLSASTELTVTAATLVSLAVTPDRRSIPKTVPQRYTVVGGFSDGTSRDLTDEATWSSSNPAVATVARTEPGLTATTLTAGDTTLTASFAGQSAKSALTVTDASLVSLSVAPARASIPRWTTQRFSATGTFTDQSTVDMTDAVIWCLSARCDRQPDVEGNVVGVYPVSARFADKFGEGELEIFESDFEALVITPANPTVSVGGALPFKAEGIFVDALSQAHKFDVTRAAGWRAASTAGAIVDVENSPMTAGLARGRAPGAGFVVAGFIKVAATEITVTGAAPP